METTIILGFYRDYRVYGLCSLLRVSHSLTPLYRDNGKENGNYYNIGVL